MPYADPETKRAYQREWAQRRRAELLGGAVCMKCGASDGLELHHLVKDEKVSHRITTWATARAKAEAAKCWILCGSCHRDSVRLPWRLPLRRVQGGASGGGEGWAASESNALSTRHRVYSPARLSNSGGRPRRGC